MVGTIGGIYQIKDLINGQLYIGSTVNFKQRKRQHFNSLRINKHSNQKLQNFYNKYGENFLEFSTIEEFNVETIVNLKELLLSKEQDYLDKLKPTLNIAVTAGSCLGIRKDTAKHYSYNKKGFYQVSFKINSLQFHFGCFKKEEDAIERVAYLNTLTDTEKITFRKSIADSYLTTSNGKIRKRSTKAKNYTFNKRDKKYMVNFVFNNVTKYFGSYNTEEEAKDKVAQIRKEYGIE